MEGFRMEDVPALGSSVALFRFWTISLMEPTVPFLLATSIVYSALGNALRWEDRDPRHGGVTASGAGQLD